MQRLREETPLQSLGKVPVPNPGRLMLPFPNRPSPTLLHVLESQGEAEIPYRGGACTLHQKSSLVSA